MGCLNSGQGFSHWFGNIHLSGPCNRSCYFCIGQHMMALDSFDNLDVWPLTGLDEFVQRCRARGVGDVNLTGTNTDPLLYHHVEDLIIYLRRALPGVKLGIRTNGVLALKHPERWRFFDKASISVTSMDPAIYRATMGQGEPPDIAAILRIKPGMDVKANVVLCQETRWPDVAKTITGLERMGIRRINLREPYGQPHVGDPFAGRHARPDGYRLGMPIYRVGKAEVMYWDVHYVEVESVNLYASGHISEDYPITRGHDDATGDVRDQSQFAQGRHREQWVQIRQQPSDTTGGKR